MKRIIVLSLTVIILIVSLSFGASAAKKSVFDFTGTMSDDQIASVEKTCASISNEYGLDVIYVITNRTNGKRIDKYAADFFDNYHEHEDAVVFVFNSDVNLPEDEDNWVIIGFGKGKKLASNSDTRAALIEDMRYALKGGRYYEASKYYTDKCRSFAEGGFKGDPVDVKKLVIRIGIAVVVGFIISYVIVSSMKKKLKSAVKQRGAMAYIKNDTSNITVARDLFMYSTTSRVRRESSSSGGGHSYSGSSSGGSSYSGGGGRI